MSLKTYSLQMQKDGKTSSWEIILRAGKNLFARMIITVEQSLNANVKDVREYHLGSISHSLSNSDDTVAKKK